MCLTISWLKQLESPNSMISAPWASKSKVLMLHCTSLLCPPCHLILAAGNQNKQLGWPQMALTLITVFTNMAPLT